MIKLSKETEQHMIASIQRYFGQHMDEEIGDLKAAMLLAFCVEEIGPSIYNLAIKDAQAHLATQVEDLGGTCYEAEYGYWKRGKESRAPGTSPHRAKRISKEDR